MRVRISVHIISMLFICETCKNFQDVKHQNQTRLKRGTPGSGSTTSKARSFKGKFRKSETSLRNPIRSTMAQDWSEHRTPGARSDHSQEAGTGSRSSSQYMPSFQNSFAQLSLPNSQVWNSVQRIVADSISQDLESICPICEECFKPKTCSFSCSALMKYMINASGGGFLDSQNQNVR